MKGYAVSTVMKLLVCMIAVAVVVWLIFKYVMKSPISKQECAAMTSAWCSQCQFVDWKGGEPMGERLKECADQHSEFQYKGSCDCDYCRFYLPGIECPP